MRAERKGDISLEFTDGKPEKEQHIFGCRDLGSSLGFFLGNNYSSLPFPTLFPTAHLPPLPHQTTPPPVPLPRHTQYLEPRDLCPRSEKLPNSCSPLERLGRTHVLARTALNDIYRECWDVDVSE